MKGAAFYARLHYGERLRRGFDFVVDSTIPAAGGASSSSALTVLAGAAVRDANGIACEPAQLARHSARAEWFVGTRGGSMDHVTICLARRMQAVHISYADDRVDRVPMTLPGIRWLTFFSHSADKGREVMLEYNERAAVSRIVIPALIEGWRTRDRDRFAAWHAAAEAARGGAVAALDELEGLVRHLPESLSLAELEGHHPNALAECRLAFPALVRDRGERPLRIRERALHHVGEVRRVAAAVLGFRSAAAGSPVEPRELLAQLGMLLNASHESLRDLYGVSTPEVERLRDIVVSDRNVFGARLMGGGFGGNVLALTTAEHAAGIVDRVQKLYYATRPPDRRD